LLAWLLREWRAAPERAALREATGSTDAELENVLGSAEMTAALRAALRMMVNEASVRVLRAYLLTALEDKAAGREVLGWLGLGEVMGGAPTMPEQEPDLTGFERAILENLRGLLGATEGAARLGPPKP
jgi:hypothetical protein